MQTLEQHATAVFEYHLMFCFWVGHLLSYQLVMAKKGNRKCAKRKQQNIIHQKTIQEHINANFETKIK